MQFMVSEPSELRTAGNQAVELHYLSNMIQMSNAHRLAQANLTISQSHTHDNPQQHMKTDKEYLRHLYKKPRSAGRMLTDLG